MKRHLDSYPGGTSAVLMTALVAAFGCGGTTTFQDTTPIRVAIAAPAPPPPPQKLAEPEKQVKIRDNHIEIGEKIQFALAEAKILPVSFAILDELTKVIQENPHVQRISIEGHASNEGDDTYNLNLSKARAEAVKQYLVQKGVAADRLSSAGFGETKPLASNDTEKGRETNRRVEFNITKQEVTKEKVEVDPQSGSEKVIEKTSANQEKPE
jgi:outer membrane protein OmpA-like peptidoglycan-associated protein